MPNETQISQTRVKCRVLLDEISKLRGVVLDDGREIRADWQKRVHRAEFEPSAENLSNYLALRRHDLRNLQLDLMPLGLSSLGRCEGRVKPVLDAVCATLSAIIGENIGIEWPTDYEFYRGERLLEENADHLFGSDENRRVRIMVTLPTEAATDPMLIKRLVECGANCVRINCAHDKPEIWTAMIANVKETNRQLERDCRILMDLAGPKARTTQVKSEKGRRIKTGDQLLLVTKEDVDDDNYVFQTHCSLPAVFGSLKISDAVWIDDGKIEAKIVEQINFGFVLEIVRTSAKGEKLKDDKSINFPGVELNLPPLTDKDLKDLDFVVKNADMIGYSFVQCAEDITRLQDEVTKRTGGKLIPVIAKIETQRAVSNLPEIIIEAAGKHPLSVMIARGDLAIDLGFERLSEMQEEILWICEAAQVPVVWATQVLESFVKNGLPSRGEITDAAMSERAECVMLNKGPFLVDAVTILGNVLTRMAGHQLKKTPQMRALKAWS